MGESALAGRYKREPKVFALTFCTHPVETRETTAEKKKGEPRQKGKGVSGDHDERLVKAKHSAGGVSQEEKVRWSQRCCSEEANWVQFSLFRKSAKKGKEGISPQEGVRKQEQRGTGRGARRAWRAFFSALQHDERGGGESQVAPSRGTKKKKLKLPRLMARTIHLHRMEYSHKKHCGQLRGVGGWQREGG